MLKIKQISFILVILALSGCAPGRVANKYLPTVLNSGKFMYGGWIVVEIKEGKQPKPSGTVSGELISLKDHQLFVLDTAKMNIIPDSCIYRAKLYIYKKQPEIFIILTLIGILPNVIAAIAVPEYAGQFLAMGLVPLLIGTIFTVQEGANKRNQLIYPRVNSLEQFNKFSRFPQGIPPGLDIDHLKLPELK
jgi:hypothetical protein